MPKIPKGVSKKTFHNPNARDASSNLVFEELSQNPCVMLVLEVLHICPSQTDALLLAIGIMD